MEGQTKVLWDFLETAYKTGMLDEVLRLSTTLTDKKYEDQALMYADLEDSITEMEDFSTVDDTLEKIYGIMPDITDEEVLEGITILLTLLNPFITAVMEKADRDTENVTAMRMDLVENLRKVGKALKAFISIGSKFLVPVLDGKSANKYGHDLGKAMNGTTTLVNGIHANDSEAVSEFMCGVFDEVDSEEMNKMLDILTSAFLDRKPPLFKWMAAMMFKRTKKRILNK